MFTLLGYVLLELEYDVPPHQARQINNGYHESRAKGFNIRPISAASLALEAE
jgi:hypothetical protein